MLFEWVGGGGGFLTALTLLGLFLVNRTLTAYIFWVWFDIRGDKMSAKKTRVFVYL